MTLSDKIINLRKQKAWSQEELAEKLDVSRQSISKWESAQSLPEVDKIIRLAKIFGVSTDFLLMEEIENDNTITATEEEVSDEVKKEVKTVNLKEANDYLDIQKRSSILTAIGVFLCILSPITLIILAAVSEYFPDIISENIASFIGIVPLFVIVAVAVAIFIYSASKSSPFKYLDGDFDLCSDATECIKEKQSVFLKTYSLMNIIAAAICIISPIPIFAGAFIDNEFLTVLMVPITMVIAGIGVMIFVTFGVRKLAFDKLLHEGEFLKQKSKTNLRESIDGAYWVTVVSIYLCWSLISNNWGKTWLVWPIAVFVFFAFSAVMDIIFKKEK